jgi:hypothetical protein
MRQMKPQALGLFGLLALAACATPLDRCLNRETRTYRMTQSRVATLEQDIARGYSLVEEDVSRTRWVPCGPRPRRETGDKKGDDGRDKRGGGRARLCLEDYDVTITRRVRVDTEIAEAELGVLRSRLKKLRAPTEAAMAQCRVEFPAES